MKKLITLILAVIITISCCIPVFADGKVTYTGDAQNIVFEPGSEHSLTDLFTEFKDVMPGDSITSKILVKNNASDKVKVKLYIRSLGAHEDSVDFLSRLNLKVKTSDKNTMAYMFDAAAHETAGLTDWVLLGTLYSGGEVNLDVTLDVPVELDNKYSDQIGYIDWEFKVEEYPVESGDPVPPKTGDNSTIWWVLIWLLSIAVIFIVVFKSKNKRRNEEVQN